MLSAFAIAIGFLLGVLFAGILIVVDESRSPLRAPAPSRCPREEESDDSDPDDSDPDNTTDTCARKTE